MVPIPVHDLELSDPTAAPLPNSLGQTSMLVRLHGVPLGVVSLLEGDCDAEVDLRTRALQDFAGSIEQHAKVDGSSSEALTTGAFDASGCRQATPSSSRLVTVVVCSLGEDLRLVETVLSILDQTHRELELLVVDNRPASGRAREMLRDIADPRLRVVDQPRPGLSAARNAGAGAAAGSVIAYTDDDAFADPNWVRSLVRPFDEHDDVLCTAGLVLPAVIDTQAQAWFEEFGAFDKGVERTVWAARAHVDDVTSLGRRGRGGVLFPYSPGVFGSGNNMAFRLDWLRSTKLFDEALGAGTMARGGEDLDAFLTVMLAGGVLVYEPRAIVRHYARADLASLKTQMFGYGAGMAAVIAKHLAMGPRESAGVLARLPAGLRKLLAPTSEKNEHRSTTYPSDLVRSELAGYLAGPILYALSRREATRRRARHPTSTAAAGERVEVRRPGDLGVSDREGPTASPL
jgi:GT2 family glycosyltransferase